MQTMLRILERAGGYRPSLYLRIENPPYMALVIEATPEPGPLGLSPLLVQGAIPCAYSTMKDAGDGGRQVAKRSISGFQKALLVLVQIMSMACNRTFHEPAFTA